MPYESVEFQNGWKDIQPVPDSDVTVSTGPIVSPDQTDTAKGQDDDAA